MKIAELLKEMKFSCKIRTYNGKLGERTLEITFQKVEHRYQYKTPFERRALYDVDVSFPSGGYYAIIGHTGSGKSTMIQHLNGLLHRQMVQFKLVNISFRQERKKKAKATT